jgi:ubiquinone biosynthesis protein COQ9
VRGLVVVWLWALRAFERDTTDDLAPTMAALDTALQRAHAAAGWLAGGRKSTSAEPGEDASMTNEEG